MLYKIQMNKQTNKKDKDVFEISLYNYLLYKILYIHNLSFYKIYSLILVFIF